MTGAISSVKSGDIENRTVVDVNQSLQGKTAGVQMISSSAAPGTESSIRVRVNSIVNIDPWLQISSQNSVTYHAQNSLAENDPYVSVLRAALALDPLTRNTYPASALPKNMQELLDNGRKLVSDGKGNYYGISKFQLGDDINPYILINTRSQRTWGTFTQGNTALNFKPIKGLVFTSRLGYRFASMFNNIYQAAYYATAARNVQDPTVNQTATQKKYYQWENFANYNMSHARPHRERRDDGGHGRLRAVQPTEEGCDLLPSAHRAAHRQGFDRGTLIGSLLDNRVRLRHIGELTGFSEYKG